MRSNNRRNRSGMSVMKKKKLKIDSDKEMFLRCGSFVF